MNKGLLLRVIFGILTTLSLHETAFAQGYFSSPILVSAELVKPYTQIEYNGDLYEIRNMAGGHNKSVSGEVVEACTTNPPVLNAATGRWVVPVTNSLIHFSTDTSPLGRLKLGSIEETTTGFLDVINSSSSSQLNELAPPVNSVFNFRVRLELLDVGVTLFSRNNITVTASNLPSWPPPVGTVYYQNDNIDLIAMEGGPTIATLLPDTTVITSVMVVVPEPSGLALFSIGSLLGCSMLLRRRRCSPNPSTQVPPTDICP